MPLRDLALDLKPTALPADVGRFIREAILNPFQPIIEPSLR